MNSTHHPPVYTCLSPALLNLYDITDSIVVIIDVLRATSTIATALHHQAASVIPVDSVPECIRIGSQIGGITAGERDGKVAEGLEHGNSPFEYPESFIGGKTLVLTTTNGTRLLHMALGKNAGEIVTGAFANLSVLCDYLLSQKKPVLLGCAAWKDRVNIEDTLFAGAVLERLETSFTIRCDASRIALSMYKEAKSDLFGYMRNQQASHYLRLSSFGLEKDIQHCLTADTAPVVPIYKEGKLIRY